MVFTKKLKGTITALCVFLIALILFGLFTYSTKENEYVVVKQFGTIKTISKDAGLGFKIPFIQTTNSIPKSKQFYDLPASEVITSDKKTMVIDAYIVWKVTDAKLFTQKLNANTKTAEGRIDVIVYNAIKNTVSSMTQEELIASRNDDFVVSDSGANLDDIEINDLNESVENANVNVVSISDKVLAYIGSLNDQYGIEITNIEVKKLDLPPENKAAVYERMISERNNIAAAYKAQGEAEAQIIRNTTDKEVSVKVSEAEANAAAIIAEGEAEYMKILSSAYNDASKADFYLYALSLDAAKESLTNGNNTLFIDANSPLAQVFNGVK